MQHRHQPTRFGRGKRYEFATLPDDAQQQLKDRFVRHTEVCDRIGRHPQFPICYATYPDSARWVWWVVDEWTEGEPVVRRLSSPEPIPLPIAARWACELIRGLAVLHTVGIVRRELSPENVLVRATDESLMLTDFELAKLARKQAELERKYQADLPEIRRVLIPFITPGNRQLVKGKWVYLEKKQPLSLSGILSRQPLDEDDASCQRLCFIGGSNENDRPNGPFPGYIGGRVRPGNMSLVRKVQRLLLTYGDLMVEKGLLTP